MPNPSVDDRAIWQHLTFSGKGFGATTDLITVAGTAEVPFALIKNPSASGKIFRFKEFLFTLAGTSTQFTRFRVYGAPTISANGTAVTPLKLRTSQTQTTSAEVYTSPTITSKGVLLQAILFFSGTSSRDLEAARYMEPGDNLLITVQPGTTNLEHAVFAAWAEVGV